MPSFRSILVAADLSERSVAAFRVACSLADAAATRVIVLLVSEGSPVVEEEVGFTGRDEPVACSGQGPAHLRAALERLREVYVPDQPLEVEYRVVEGEPAEEILRAAEEVDADLIALGTRGRTGLGRLLAGSVAEAVLRRSDRPVLALHAPEGAEAPAGPIRVILHPTDYSSYSRPAFDVARGLAVDQGAHLLLLHVVGPFDPSGALGPAGTAGPRTWFDPLITLRDRAEGPNLKCPVEIRCERDDPAGWVLRVAEETRCDLIVLGSHGHGTLGRLLMGSVAEAIARRATCPTLIIKPAPARSGGMVGRTPSEGVRIR